MAAQPSPSEFQPYRAVQGQAEKELRAILESTAKAIEKRVARLKPGIGGVVRAAQLKLTLAAVNKLLSAMWVGRINPLVARSIEESMKAGDSAVEALTRVAYAGLPDAAADELVRSLRLSAESGLKSDAARRKRDLSRRVYNQRALDDGRVEKIIRQGLISNLSAKELASDVYQYVSPTTPGVSAYASMRLARTEVNNAFHERQLQGANRPGVKAVIWNLSGSHRVPDLCNVYAAHNGNGHWAVDNVPDKPHPQCFCYLTYETMSSEDFQKKLASGGFDDEIERRTRENMAALGQPVGDLNKGNAPKRALEAVKDKQPKIPSFDQKGFKPKKWEKVTDNEADIQEAIKSVLTLVPKDKQAENAAKDGPDWARKFAVSIIEGSSDEDETKYSNGPHRVRFSGKLAKDVDAQKRFLTDFDKMQSTFPTGHAMSISVAPSSQFEYGVGGETTLSTGSMFINEKYLTQKQPWSGMPVSSGVTAAQYILAHEWGHSLSTKDEADDHETHNHAIDMGGMSIYGKSTSREGYAEAFAEWALSRGKTLNKAAQDYAQKFKWGDRFVFDQG